MASICSDTLISQIIFQSLTNSEDNKNMKFLTHAVGDDVDDWCLKAVDYLIWFDFDGLVESVIR